MDNSNYRYVVNEDAGVVVCLMGRNDFIEEAATYALNKLCRILENAKFSQYFNYDDIFHDAVKNYLSKNLPLNDVRAIARCNFEAGDSFDEFTGRLIAARRMDLNIAEVALGLLDSIFREFDFFLDEVGRRATNIERYCHALKKDIKEITEFDGENSL